MKPEVDCENQSEAQGPENVQPLKESEAVAANVLLDLARIVTISAHATGAAEN